MKIKNYIEYFKYILEHKKNVFKTCWKRKLYIHAFTHDLSKFLPSEFFPYAKWFYGSFGIKLKNIEEQLEDGQSCLSRDFLKCKKEFEKAWEQHYLTNKHHWNCWIGLEMPRKYILQMVCDWEAMSLKFGDTAQAFYLKNYNKMNLHRETRFILERVLKITIDIPFQINDYHLYMTLEEIIKDFEEYKKNNPNTHSNWIEKELIPYYKEKYNVDISHI